MVIHRDASDVLGVVVHLFFNEGEQPLQRRLVRGTRHIHPRLHLLVDVVHDAVEEVLLGVHIIANSR